MDRSEPVARCAWCVELNPLSANYCKHCGHEAHATRAECHCRRCMAAISAALDEVGARPLLAQLSYRA